MRKFTLMFFMSLFSVCAFAQLPLENFETWPPTGWGIYDNGSGTIDSWEQSEENNIFYPPYAGTYAAFIDNENVPDTNPVPQDWLVTTQFTVPNNPQLRFFSRLTMDGNNGGLYRIMISNLADQSDLASYTQVIEWTETEINPTQDDYVEKQVDLPETLIGQQVYVAFVMVADDGDRWLVDNVSVVEQCLAPTEVEIENIGLNTADITWENPEGYTNWEIEIVEEANPFTGTGVTYNGLPPYNAASLTEATDYKVKVRAVCAPGNNSEWSEPVSFTTAFPPPANDACADAVMLTVNPDNICTAVTAGTIQAATQSVEATTCGGTEDDDVWYRFVATDTTHLIRLLDTEGSTEDLFHVVYSGADCGALTELYCSDNDNSTAEDLVIGQTYTVRVYTWTSTPDQTTTFNICIGTPPPPPVNDECAAAVTVTVNPTLECAAVTPGTIYSATASPEANTCNGTDDDDVWFEFTATNGIHTINLQNITGGTTDLYHTVYEGDDCGTLTEMYCSDPEESVASGLTIGTVYKVRVYSWTGTANQTSAFEICIGTPPAPPANDECTAAVTVPVNPDLTCTQTVGGTIAWATPSDAVTACNGNADDDVWFEFEATSTSHTINLNNVSGSTTNLDHAIYTGDDCGTMTELYCSAGNSSLVGGLIIGETYKIRVYSNTATAGQDTTFDVCIGTPPPPPANDDCDDAIVVGVNPDLECTEVASGIISWSTPSPEANTCSGTADDDVWFEFVAENTIHTVNLQNITGGTTDLYHVLYEGDECGTLTQLYCSDNNSSVATGLTIGNTYKIRVYSWTANTGQTSAFDVCVGTPPPPPANDDCDNAISVLTNPDLNCTNFGSGTVAWATASAEASTCNGTEDDDVWFEFVATNEIHTINLNNVTGSATDLMHVLYEGDECDSLTQLYCSDPDSSIATGLTVGDIYKIRVYSYTSTAGQDTTFDVCIGTPPPPPANDECAGAVEIPVNPTNACEQVVAGTVEWTTPSVEGNTCNGTADDDVWFEFEATSTTHYIKLLDRNGSTIDLMHVLYQGDECGTLTQLYCSDPENSTATGLVIGETYKVRVYSYTLTTGQNTTFNICVSTPAASQPNDDCETAIVAEVNDNSLCTVTTPGSVESATASDVENGCEGTADDDVWYEFTATHTQHYIALLNEGGNRLSTDNMVHAVYSGDCATLTEVYCSGNNNSIADNLVIGETYKIRIFSNADTPQSFVFRLCIGVILTCDDSEAFCANNDSEGVTFPGSLGVPNLGAVSCLFTTPNPTYYFLQIENSGDLELNISQTSYNGDPIDVDFIAYGPFADLENGCANLTSANEVDCSYSASAVEPFSIPGAVAGQYYVVMITNFNGTQGTINFTQPNFGETGAGTTDCSIVCTADLGEDQVLCGETEYVLDSGIINAESYTWFLDGEVIPGADGQTYTATESGTYTVEITKAACENNPTDEVNITFLPTPELADQEDVVLCGEEGEASFDLTTVDAQVLGALNPADYTVTYYLTEADALAGTNPIDTTVPFTTTSQTIYTRVDTNALAGCFDVTALPIVVNEFADATIAYEGSPYCSDAGTATVTLTGSTGGTFTAPEGLIIDAATGAVDLAAGTAGTYTVTYTIAATATCDEFVTTGEITVFEAPSAVIAYESSPYCATGTATVTLTGTTGGTFTSDAGLVIDAVTGEVDLAASTPGTHTVTYEVAPAVPCSGVTATAEIVINELPVAEIVYEGSPYCVDNEGAVVTLTGDTGGVFSTDAGLVVDAVTGEIDLTASTPGIYTVTYTIGSANGCPDVTAVTQVTVASRPDVTIGEECDGNNYTLSAVFNNDVYNADNVTFLWTTEAGVELGTELTQVVEETGIYYLTVMPAGTDDCSTVIEVNVTSVSCMIPKGISPNGDSMNDRFDLDGFNVTKLSIFNRYGQEVYSRSNYTDEWFGQSDSGDELPSGTYFYSMERANGESKTGWVYVNRQEN